MTRIYVAIGLLVAVMTTLAIPTAAGLVDNRPSTALA